MKIAIISMIRDNWGGSEALWYDMAQQALAQGHQVVHLSYATAVQHPHITKLQTIGLQEYKRPAFFKTSDSFIKNTISRLAYFINKRTHRALEKIFDQQPDVVIYNGTCYSIAEEKKLLQLLHKNSSLAFYIIGHLNPEGASGLTDSEIVKIVAAYQRATKIFFVSERSMQNAARHLSYTIKHGRVIRNPVNLQDISLVDFPALDVPQMAVVGNLVNIHKGQHLLLKILAKPEWQQQPWHLHLYGSGKDEQMLKDFAAANNMAGRVTFHGKVDDIRKVWQHNHLLLMPSLMEGTPLALVEAMLCGRPAVVTDVGGNAEWIQHAHNGFVAKEATEAAFEVALQQAFVSKHTWEHMGKRAHETAMRLHDKEAGKTLLSLIL